MLLDKVYKGDKVDNFSFENVYYILLFYWYKFVLLNYSLDFFSYIYPKNIISSK